MIEASKRDLNPATLVSQTSVLPLNYCSHVRGFGGHRESRGNKSLNWSEHFFSKNKALCPLFSYALEKCPEWDSNPQDSVFEADAFANFAIRACVVAGTGFEPVSTAYETVEITTSPTRKGVPREGFEPPTLVSKTSEYANFSNEALIMLTALLYLLILQPLSFLLIKDLGCTSTIIGRTRVEGQVQS